MNVYYEKKLINKVIHSGIFTILLLGIVSVFLIKDEDWAVILTVGPGIIYLFLKICSLLPKAIHILKKDKPVFLSSGNGKLKVYEIGEEEIELLIDEIQRIEWSRDRVCVRLKQSFDQQRRTFLHKLFRFYWIDNCNYYTYSLYCKAEELEYLCKSSKIMQLQGIKGDERWVNIFRRYVIIVAGIANFFIWLAIGNYNLSISLWILVFLGIIEIVLRIKNRASLAEDGASVGLLGRCAMFSLFAAQYIFCAVRIQEALKQELFLNGCPLEVGIIFLIIYIVVIVLYLPKRGLGEK